jgi:putative transposase
VDLTYPFHDQTVPATHYGRIGFEDAEADLSHLLPARMSPSRIGEHIWLVTFTHDDLGYLDDETCRLEPIENPFVPKVLPMSPE